MKNLALPMVLLIPILFFLFCTTETSEAQKQKEMPSLAAVYTDTIQKEPVVLLDTTISLDYLMGKFDPAKHGDFIKVDAKYASRSGFLLRKATYEAFKKMSAAATENGISLKIISATRPFPHQKRIWEAKWNGSRKVDGQDLSKTMTDPVGRALKILEYSSMPGTSRHHWGTDIDINALTNGYFEKGKGLKEYNWLVENGPKFGFCQPYSPKGEARPYGYNEEKWHWSYLPIAKKLTDQYKLHLKDETISGFKGAETATQIEVKKKYVLGINQECL